MDMGRESKGRTKCYGEFANLPARLDGKTSDGHAERGAPGARDGTLLVGVAVILAAGAAGELDDEALAHEVRTICSGTVSEKRRSLMQAVGAQ